MTMARLFRLGIVEGFFGRQWTWEARHAFADFLAAQQCNSYVYAPKNDPWLRKQWHEPFPAAHLQSVQKLATHCHERGVEFGIGLSPYELYRDFSAANRVLLKNKVEQINAIGPRLLCILFDDMMGDLHNLAAVQLDIVEFIRAHAAAANFAICPTYYSSDPLLTKHFGSQPEHYLEDLGHGLDSQIDIFWTGPRVISDSYPRAHLQEVADKLQRKPLLWDNYPVNDAKRLTSFLHLKPFTNRGPELRELCSGHLANPMNQAWLSQLPLYSLPALYADRDYDPARAFAAACRALCPPALAEALLEDAEQFQSIGLSGLSTTEKQRLSRKYAAIAHPMAEEVQGWLAGGYDFDPACLT